MLAIRTLQGWGDFAQIVLASAAVAALAGAVAQLLVSRAAARRGRVFEYRDLLNTPESLQATAAHMTQWPQWTIDDFMALPPDEQLKWLRLPNIVEQYAYLYNRNLIDQRVAAEQLGVYAERLWKASEHVAKGMRTAEERPRVFVEWERMQSDTWKRRGAGGPMGVVAPEPSRFHPPTTVLRRARWVVSADYRRDCRKYGHHRRWPTARP
jgi:hypothetical protein